MSFDLRINQGDLVIGSDGDLSKVEDVEKLIQDVLKILMTPIGANVFFTWYGSLLSGSMVGQVMDATFRRSAVEQQIRSNLETLQRMQKQQAANGQRVTPGELLAAIQNIQVHRNVVDPTYFTVAVRILTKGFQSATATFDTTL